MARNSAVWERLHGEARHRPRYPSEPVIRFLAGQRASGGIVLDMGCGTGRHLRLAEELGFRAVGSDVSTTGLKFAGGAVVRATMTSLPFRDAAFDVVVAYGVLYYGIASEFGAALREVHRVLRPGGRVLVVTRSDRDFRFGRGEQVEPNTWRQTDDVTGEQGSVQHFLSRDAVDAEFSDFADVTVGWQEFTSGVVVNHDWVIEAQR